MASRSLFITDVNGRITEEIEVDVLVRHSVLDSALITEYPVESGALIADHVQAVSPELTMDVFIATKPVRQPTTQTGGVTYGPLPKELNLRRMPPRLGLNAALNALSGKRPPEQALVLQASGNLDRPSVIHNRLRTALENGEGFLFSTETRDLLNLVLEEIQASREESQAGGLWLSLRFRQIRTVSSEPVESPAPKEPRGEGSVNKGKQAIDTEPAESGRKTLLQAGLERLGVL